MADVKKYFSSKMPRGVATYLFDVTRDDGQFVHADLVGHRLQIEWPHVLHAVGQETVLLAHDFFGNLQDRAGALVEALHQPVGTLQAVPSDSPCPCQRGAVFETIV